jgi:hypothetical protein
VSTTVASAENSTTARLLWLIEIFFTLPTSTPAIRTKSPSARPLTSVNWALYVRSAWNRSWAKIAVNETALTMQTTTKAAKPMIARRRLFVTAEFLDDYLVDWVGCSRCRWR